MKRLFLLSTIAALSSCAHLSQEQCMTMNWYNEGLNDGQAGKTMRDLSRAIEDCSRYNIPVNTRNYQTGWREGARQYCTPSYETGYESGVAGAPESDIYDRLPICTQASVKLNLSTYQAGRNKGLRSFCTYDNGVNFARQGKPFPEICPPSLRAKFFSGWSSGKEKFCSQPESAFALGKENKPYPTMCIPELYVAFKSEYDRGIAIGQRANDIKAKVNALNNNIDSQANRYSLIKNDTGYYSLGFDKSKDAMDVLSNVNAMVREKQPLDSELFNLQVMK